MTDMVGLRFNVSKELHKELRLLAVQDDTTLQKLLPVLIVAGMAHHAQEAKVSIEKPRRIKRTDGTRRTKSTEVTALIATPE
jgi:hypothetical protein